MKTKRILQVSALALAMSVVTAQAADRIAFIPKLVGVGFFTSGGNGAKEAGKALGVDVTYDGPTGAQRLRSGAAYQQLRQPGLQRDYRLRRFAGRPVPGAEAGDAARGESPDLGFRYQTGVPQHLYQPGHAAAARRPAGGDGGKAGQQTCRQSRVFLLQPDGDRPEPVGEGSQSQNRKEHPQWQIVTTQFGYNDATKSLQTAEGS